MCSISASNPGGRSGPIVCIFVAYQLAQPADSIECKIFASRDAIQRPPKGAVRLLAARPCGRTWSEHVARIPVVTARGENGSNKDG